MFHFYLVHLRWWFNFYYTSPRWLNFVMIWIYINQLPQNNFVIHKIFLQFWRSSVSTDDWYSSGNKLLCCVFNCLCASFFLCVFLVCIWFNFFCLCSAFSQYCLLYVSVFSILNCPFRTSVSAVTRKWNVAGVYWHLLYNMRSKQVNLLIIVSQLWIF